MQRTLREIGINLTIRTYQQSTNPEMQEIDHQMMLIGFSPSADPDMSTYFHSDGNLKFGSR